MSVLNFYFQKNFIVPEWKVENSGLVYESSLQFNGVTFKVEWPTKHESKRVLAKKALEYLKEENPLVIENNLIYVALLQELCQAIKLASPTYETFSSSGNPQGPFLANVIVNGLTFYGTEACTKKQDAKEHCAKEAFCRLGNQKEILDAYALYDSTFIYDEASAESVKKQTRRNSDFTKELLMLTDRMTTLGQPFFRYRKESSGYTANLILNGRQFESVDAYPSKIEAADHVSKIALITLQKEMPDIGIHISDDETYISDEEQLGVLPTYQDLLFSYLKEKNATVTFTFTKSIGYKCKGCLVTPGGERHSLETVREHIYKKNAKEDVCKDLYLIAQQLIK